MNIFQGSVHGCFEAITVSAVEGNRCWVPIRIFKTDGNTRHNIFCFSIVGTNKIWILNTLFMSRIVFHPSIPIYQVSYYYYKIMLFLRDSMVPCLKNFTLSISQVVGYFERVALPKRLYRAKPSHVRYIASHFTPS